MGSRAIRPQQIIDASIAGVPEMIESDYKFHSTNVNRVLLDYSGSCNSDVRVYKPKKAGQLSENIGDFKLVDTVKVNFKASLLSIGRYFEREEFTCIDCKCSDTRVRKNHLPSKKIRCFACQTNYVIEYLRIKRADRRLKANKNAA